MNITVTNAGVVVSSSKTGNGEIVRILSGISKDMECMNALLDALSINIGSMRLSLEVNIVKNEKGSLTIFPNVRLIIPTTKCTQNI